ncbi:uncharacterized protein LOC122048780 [Zingiber officinale]|uniref:uncharacterized protein LOC122048780 n=1 Tax=Zingiber officinale TaxID=94328 RepID=UPI001C4D6854|nr:uncharacterized protein LOC122048780 [Zingiber officinale]
MRFRIRPKRMLTPQNGQMKHKAKKKMLMMRNLWRLSLDGEKEFGFYRRCCHRLHHLLLLALLCLPAATTASTAFFFFFFFFFSPCHAHPVSCPIRPRRSADSSRVPINNFCNRYDKFCPFYKLVWMMRNIIHFNTLANQAVERGAGSNGQKITYSIIKH